MLDDEGRPVLGSCARPVMWTTRTLVARHLTEKGQVRNEHSAPGRGCECGVYAVHEVSSSWLERLGGRATITGAVRLSGTVRRHRDEGVRAAVAEIVALARPDQPLWAFSDYRAYTHFPLYQDHRRAQTSPVDAEQLAERYGVPLVDLEHLTMVALEHGDRLWP